MEEKLLAQLSASKFMLSSGWNFGRTWSGKIDISVWLRASLMRGGRIYLLLEIQDQESKRIIPIDRCLTPSPDSMLLNGRVSLVGKGPLESMNIKLKFEGCDRGSIVVEELVVKPLQAPTVPRRMPAAV